MNIQPIKLMKVVTNFGCGGTEKQVKNLVTRMDRERFDLSFSCMQKSGPLLEEFVPLQIKIDEYRIRSFYRPSTWVQQIRFAAALRRNRVEVLHSYNFYANLFAVPAARLAGVPVIIASIRDQGIYLTPNQARAQKLVCSMANRVLVNAESIKSWLLEQNYNESAISVIKNGVDLSCYADSGRRNAVRDELGIPEEATVFILVARLNPQKGLDDFIRAAAEIRSKFPNAFYLVVGENPVYSQGGLVKGRTYREELMDMAEHLGLGNRMVFVGHREDIPALLSAADISVLPSHSEGLSNTLLESMAAGLAVIATDVGGTPELVIDDVNGLLVPPTDPARLATAMQRLLDDSALRERIGGQAIKTVKEKFCINKMVADTESLYLSELNRFSAKHAVI